MAQNSVVQPVSSHPVLPFYMQNIDSVFPGFIPSDFAVIYGLARAGLDKNSLVLCNQLQTVDKSRLLKKIGRVPEERMKLVDMALICSLDLDYR